MRTYSEIRKRYGYPLKLGEVLDMLKIAQTESLGARCLESICGEAKAAIEALMYMCETGEQFADICLAEKTISDLRQTDIITAVAEAEREAAFKRYEM